MSQRKADIASLPHNLEAERSVLGAILAHNPGLDLIALTAADFYTDRHRRIYAAMQALGGERQAIDLLTVKARLERSGHLHLVGGPAYIASLVDGVPRSTNIRHYAALVREMALRRAVIALGNAIVSRAYAGEDDASALLLEADRRFLALRVDAPSALVPLRDGATALLADLEYRAAHRGEVRGIVTGVGIIDALTTGWQPGDLVILGARPSVGKTSFVVQAATAAARAGAKVGFFSFEMRRRQLEIRILSHLSGVNSMRLLAGHTSAQEAPAIAEALNTFDSLSVYIDDTGSQTVWDLRSACRRMQVEHGLDLVIIDYIQLITGSDIHRGNRNQEITEISRRLKIMAGELSVPVLALSQLSRAGNKRTDPRPRLEDLRESGSLEQDADLVAFLHRKDHREPGFTEFILAKARNGPTGTVNLDFAPQTTTFSAWAGDVPAEKVRPRHHKPTPVGVPYVDDPPSVDDGVALF